MIKDISDFLEELLKAEKEILKKYDIKHPTIIGDMYEGLTKDILSKAVPEQLNLKIVDGIIYSDDDHKTGQIDCMLVSGKGKPIPYTDHYKWHIKDVIAVFEVKKNLFSTDLVDSIDHLKAVSENYSNYLQTTTDKNSFDISSALHAYSKLTQTIAPAREDIESLPLSMQILYHTLIVEQVSPIRIVFGYEGFVSEYNLRNALIKYIENRLNTYGTGPLTLPQLTVSGEYSLLKMNGQPYMLAPIVDEKWCFMTSTPHNPLRLILELIWTRLSNRYGVSDFFQDEGLEQEILNPLLLGKAIQKEGKIGWLINYPDLTKVDLATSEKKFWEPIELDSTQHTIIAKLCSGDEVLQGDPDLEKYVNDNGYDVDEFTQSLLDTTLVALNDKEYVLTTYNCRTVILPDGRFIAGDNVTGQLVQWVQENFPPNKKI